MLLARACHRQGHEIVVLSRDPKPAPWKVVPWNGTSRGEWWDAVDGAEVVINLAGRSVNCRYHERNRREIMESRTASTRAVGEAIAAVPRPPRVWLQAGTATLYAHRYDAANDEATGIVGGSEPRVPETWRFSVEVAKAWERAVEEADTPRTRKVILRSAMIMSPDAGGVFATLLGLVRWGLGGRAGEGRQYVSWIHEEDFIAAVLWLIEREELDGAVNLASPNPLPQAEFMTELRRAWGQPLGLSASRWMLELGAIFLQTETELILKSRRVVPARLIDSGFEFRFPTWAKALRELCRRYRIERNNSNLVTTTKS